MLSKLCIVNCFGNVRKYHFYKIRLLNYLNLIFHNKRHYNIKKIELQ
jgi:hypothetical protein